MDLYTLPQHRDTMVRLIEGLGLTDVNDRWPYGTDWTYRASTGDTIVEVIWKMKNDRAVVDEPWLSRALEVKGRGLTLPVAPPEEMMWAKFYVMNRERCDWPDILNYMYFCGDELDWDHLLKRLGPDSLLLAGVLCVFAWLSPDRAKLLPESLWPRVGLAHPDSTQSGVDTRLRARMLNRKLQWYGIQERTW
jgi:hypothetical protein